MIPLIRTPELLEATKHVAKAAELILDLPVSPKQRRHLQRIRTEIERAEELLIGLTVGPVDHRVRSDGDFTVDDWEIDL